MRKLITGLAVVMFGVVSIAPAGASWSGDIRPGDAVAGPAEKHALIHQGDGNVVLYGETGQAIWHTRTHGTDTSRFVMQDDGNLVLYNASNSPIWHSGTHGNPGAKLAVQTDGNLVIYKSNGSVAWAIKHWPPKPPPAPKAVSAWGNGDNYWRLAGCETGYKYNNPNTGNGYYGYFQFDLQTWQSVGGPGYPHHHSYDVQRSYAIKLQARRGWSPWPHCSRTLGLR